MFDIYDELTIPIKTFSSLHFGMKTAIPPGIGKSEIVYHFQFPTLWDEDCNLDHVGPVDLVPVRFQFPTLWDEDCNYFNE